MRNRTRSLIVLLAGLLLWLLPAMAEKAPEGKMTLSGVQVEIKISEESGNAPYAADTYQIRLKALDEDAPMPAGSKDGVFVVSRTGAGKVTLPEIAYSQYGAYRYEVSQIAGSHPSATKYDDQVYLMEVYIFNASEQPAVTIQGEDGNKGTDLVFTNTYAERSVKATKVWNDSKNQDGKRAEVTLRVAGGKVAADVETEKTVPTAPDSIEVTWNGLPVYDADGEEIKWTVSEIGTVKTDNAEKIYLKDGAYTVDVKGNMVDGFTVTNSHTPERIELSVKKIWNDDNDKVRPGSLRMTLYADKKKVTDVTLSASNQWNAKVPNLLKYREGKQGEEIEYTWEEEDIGKGYEQEKPATAGTLTVITNSRLNKKVATIIKIWDDDNDRDRLRPKSLTVRLMDGANPVGSDIVLNEGNKWSYTEYDLPKYREDGTEIEYTWEEVLEEKDKKNYTPGTPEKTGTVTTITNTHIPETVTLTVKKVWVDGENADKTRPPSLTVVLSNGQPVKLNETNGWQASLTVPKYDQGKAIEYTWKEIDASGYKNTDTESNAGVTTLTNTLDQKKVDISGTKVWLDGGKEGHDNEQEVKLTLYRQSDSTARVPMEDQATWNGDTWTFSNLDKYDAARYLYVYSVEEDKVDGYDQAAPANSRNNYTIVNPITDPANITITGTKTWIDGNRTHNNRTEVRLILYRSSAKDGQERVVFDANPSWNGDRFTFRNLEVYDGEGYAYNYSVAERKVAGYDEPVLDIETVKVEGGESDTEDGETDTEDGEKIYHFTNRLTQEKISISGTKTWVDGGKDHINADEVVLTLSRTSGKPGSSAVTVPSSEYTIEWNEETDTYTLSELDKYDEERYEYTYSVTEKKVEEYDEPEYDGYNITNRIHDNKTTVTGAKNWVDGGRNHDNPTEVRLTLRRSANGGVIETVTATPEWKDNTYTYKGLERYDDQGYEYTYTVTEAPIGGYTSVQDGFNFTNTIVDPQNISVSGIKTWVDLDPATTHNNAAEVRLTLTRTSGDPKVTETVNATPIWNENRYTFSGLDVYDDLGYPYTYAVTEAPIPGYTITYGGQEGRDITNTYTMVGTASLTATKTIVNSDTESDEVPALNANQFTFELRNADGTFVQRVGNAANGVVAFQPITYTLDDLARSPIEYTITEVAGDDPEYAYDGHRLRVTVTLTDSGNSTMNVDVAYAGDRNFVNTWTKIPVYRLTVHYLYWRTGLIASPSVVEIHPEGEEYDVESPVIKGYRCTRLRVSGVMPGRDVVEYVYYIPEDMILEDYETPLGLGQVFINVGDCIE